MRRFVAVLLLALAAGGDAGAQAVDPASVQRALAERGFDPGPIDGLPGRKTAAAMRGFQAANGLDPSGTMTPESLAALGLIAAPAPAGETGSGTVEPQGNTRGNPQANPQTEPQTEPQTGPQTEPQAEPQAVPQIKGAFDGDPDAVMEQYGHRLSQIVIDITEANLRIPVMTTEEFPLRVTFQPPDPEGTDLLPEPTVDGVGLTVTLLSVGARGLGGRMARAPADGQAMSDADICAEVQESPADSAPRHMCVTAGDIVFGGLLTGPETAITCDRGGIAIAGQNRSFSFTDDVRCYVNETEVTRQNGVWSLAPD